MHLGIDGPYTLNVLVSDDGIHSITEPAFRPQGCNLPPKFQGEQLRVENAAIESAEWALRPASDEASPPIA